MPAAPAIQPVHSARTSAARCANAAHWRSDGVLVTRGSGLRIASAPAGNGPAQGNDGVVARAGNPTDGPVPAAMTLWPQSLPATVIAPTRIEPVRMCERGST